MSVPSAGRRVLPLVGTAAVLGLAAWQLIASAVPLSVALEEVLLLLCACAAMALSLQLRLPEHVAAAAVTLLFGLTNLLLVCSILVVAAPWAHPPLALTAFAFIAVLLSVDPAAPRWVRGSLALSAMAGLALVWWRTTLFATSDTGELLVAEALLTGLTMLAYANWSLRYRHIEAQTARLRAVADTARRLGLTREVREVAEAALLGCHDAYPEATWGCLLQHDPVTGKLHPFPALLGPDGIIPLPRENLAVEPTDGITGRVFTTGEACLLRTSEEVAAEHATTAAHAGLAELQPWATGRRARSFLAAPLRAPDRRVTGVLLLNSHVREHVWDTSDITAIQGIADQAAVAIERAHLFQEQARHAATDPLTQIGNRRAFEEYLLSHTGEGCAALAIDLDHLKELNDEYGHEAGDVMLVEVARTLREQLRGADLLARIGGDEFVAILPNTDLAEAQAIAERMRSSLHGVALPHGRARISVGVAAADKALDLRTLWGAADQALAAAKRSGRDRVASAHASADLALARVGGDTAATLESILAGDCAVRPCYQRIVGLSDGVTLGHEAVARFPRLRDTAIGVEDIFQLAHGLGVMRDLDWACRRAALESSSHLDPSLPLFLNVSAAMLLDPLHPVDQMLMLSRWTGRNPESIVLEITEREQINDKQRLREVMTGYRAHGFRFALDDVGEGNATIELLATALPEYIKLAASLVAACTEPGPRAVIQAAVAFANGIGACVVAEGIEDEQTALRIAALGVAAAQGFWLGVPEDPPAGDPQEVIPLLLPAPHDVRRRPARWRREKRRALAM